MLGEKTISVFTSTRAEFSLLKGVIKKIEADPSLKLQLIVSGTHLSEIHGNTISEVEEENIAINKKIPLEFCSNTSNETLRHMATILLELGEFYRKHKPDILIILGDRYEALAAAQVASIINIPIAHIHGGEETRGANDNQFRHAISKLSHLHFTATEEYRDRVIQMGENPNHVFNTGAPGIENIRGENLLSKGELSEILKLEWRETNLLFTFHPETINPKQTMPALRSILKAISCIENKSLIITYPNSDHGSQEIINEIVKFENDHNWVYLYKSLGMKKYLSTLKYVDLVIGNSSSGIIEAPSVKTTAIDIGERQAGRSRANSVLHSKANETDIKKIINRILIHPTPNIDFKNPYEKPNTSSSIISIIKNTDFDSLKNKQFYDKETTL